jgi:localization factor PodJL
MDALSAAQTEEDAMSAVGKLQDAAALGFPPAQLQLGELYKTGQGVEQDLGQARVWFRRAANGGNVLAMHRIGVMTARGDGGAADPREAIAWFEKAANFGLVDSQYNLGAIYHPSDDGASSVQDAAKAYYWYSLAARNGDNQAQPLAAGVGVALSPEARADIDARVAAWTAKPADESANASAAVN